MNPADIAWIVTDPQNGGTDYLIYTLLGDYVARIKAGADIAEAIVNAHNATLQTKEVATDRTGFQANLLTVLQAECPQLAWTPELVASVLTTAHQMTPATKTQTEIDSRLAAIDAALDRMGERSQVMASLIEVGRLMRHELDAELNCVVCNGGDGHDR
ncbi:MAG: hypothetical protein IPO08_22860 [Xanthomonadales bacterium]|nr:hypothetical protein [Xanthomonadales bacterium]